MNELGLNFNSEEELQEAIRRIREELSLGSGLRDAEWLKLDKMFADLEHIYSVVYDPDEAPTTITTSIKVGPEFFVMD